MMKRILALILSLILCFSFIVSCGKEEEPTNVPSSSEPTSSEEPRQEEANVATATKVNQEHNYYTIIDNDKLEYIGGDFPTEKGVYFKLIDSYESLCQLVKLPDNNEFDTSVFLDNYILVLKIRKSDSYYGERVIGYYGLSNIDNEYSLNIDCYRSFDGKDHADGEVLLEAEHYLLIPKESISYTDEISNVNLTVNVRSDRILYSTVIEKITSETVLSENYKVWYIGKEEARIQLETELNVNIDMGAFPCFLIYLPFDELKGDIFFKDFEIKNGDVYLTIENFTHVENDYMKDKRFFTVNKYNDQATDKETSQNYKVYITVLVTDVPVLDLVIE